MLWTIEIEQLAHPARVNRRMRRNQPTHAMCDAMRRDTQHSHIHSYPGNKSRCSELVAAIAPIHNSRWLSPTTTSRSHEAIREVQDKGRTINCAAT